MGHNSAVSGHSIFTSFLQVDDWSTDPRVLGCHSFTSYRIPVSLLISSTTTKGIPSEPSLISKSDFDDSEIFSSS